MTVDFSHMVLVPCMTTFALPVVIDPLASQPGMPSYTAGGIFTRRPTQVLTEAGVVFSDHETTLGIRDEEFAGMPFVNGLLTFPAVGLIPALGMFEVADVKNDGQGGSTLVLQVMVNPS